MASAIVAGTVPEHSAWRIRRIGVTLRGRGRERPIGVDQSNTSYVVGERVVVKLFRRLWPGTHPEIEIVEYLSGRVDSVPAFAGAVEWRGHGVALLQEYVPGGRDGWSWCGDAVMAGDVERIGRIGAISAELHAALAGMGQTSAGAGRPARLARGRRRAARPRARHRARRRRRGARPRAFPHPRRARSARDAGRSRPRSSASTATSTSARSSPPATGSSCSTSRASPPGRSPTAPRPGRPLRDVAAMLRSFDHLGRSRRARALARPPGGHRALDRRRPGGVPRGVRPGRPPAAARARVREGLLRVRLRGRVRAVVGVRAAGGDALASGARMAELRAGAI